MREKEKEKKEKTRFILLMELINVENNAYRKTSSDVVFIVLLRFLFVFVFFLCLLFFVFCCCFVTKVCSVLLVKGNSVNNVNIALSVQSFSPVFDRAGPAQWPCQHLSFRLLPTLFLTLTPQKCECIVKNTFIEAPVTRPKSGHD